MVAPFWASSDTSNRVGTVSYEVYRSETSQKYISQVSMFISQQQQVIFNGTWMLISEWSNIPQYGESVTVVSLFFNCTNTELFQFYKVDYVRELDNNLDVWLQRYHPTHQHQLYAFAFQNSGKNTPHKVCMCKSLHFVIKLILKII